MKWCTGLSLYTGVTMSVTPSGSKMVTSTPKKINISSHYVRESKTVLDPGFHAVDFGF